MTVRKSPPRGELVKESPDAFVEACSNTGCQTNRDQRTRREGGQPARLG